MIIRFDKNLDSTEKDLFNVELRETFVKLATQDIKLYKNKHVRGIGTNFQESSMIDIF